MSEFEKPAGDAAKPAFKKPGITGRKLGLTAPTPGVEGKSAVLMLGWFDGNPRFTIFTGDPDDAPDIKGRLSANMDVPTFYAVIEAIEAAANTEDGKEYRVIVENLSTTDERGQKLEKKTKISETIIGRGTDGRIFLSVIAEGRPKIKFNFGNSDWHHWRDAVSGEPLSQSHVSKTYALGYVNFLRSAIAATVVTEGPPAPRAPFVPFNKGGGGGGKPWQGGGGDRKPWQGNNGGGGGGGWKGNNGGGGGKPWQGGGGGGGNFAKKPYQAPAGEGFDDDIPF